eukprot:TRINITY_DN8206_c0_g1_i1.p1 TRINITY_DN8206_c0_g1~~TRINITY_DN8206_c0_g1_i1.p1  ORF type:complete len:107 (-),score=26.57 TRINITY_DN8206_c0_g1_i1:123-443(-)
MYFLRNFGGIRYERIDGIFENENAKGASLHALLHKHIGISPEYIRDTMNKYPPSALIQLNINDKRSTHVMSDCTSSDHFMITRNVMVITEFANSWRSLLDLNIIKL